MQTDFQATQSSRPRPGLPPENAEKTLAELRARIEAVLDFIKRFKSEQIDGSETREITLAIAGNPMTFTGAEYLTHMAVSNFYFHCTMSYAILRQCGVEIGKRDFLVSI